MAYQRLKGVENTGKGLCSAADPERLLVTVQAPAEVVLVVMLIVL